MKSTAGMIRDIRLEIRRLERERAKAETLLGHLRAVLELYEQEDREAEADEEPQHREVPFPKRGGKLPNGSISLNAAIEQVLRSAAGETLTTMEIWTRAEALGAVSRSDRPAHVVGARLRDLEYMQDCNIERNGRGWRWIAAATVPAAAEPAPNPVQQQAAAREAPRTVSVPIPAPQVRTERGQGEGDSMALTMTRQDCPKCRRQLMREDQADHSIDLVCLACGFRQVNGISEWKGEVVHA